MACSTFSSSGGSPTTSSQRICRKNLRQYLGLGHQWTEHAMSLTIAFSDAPIAVRNAFGRFHLSWVEKEVNPDRTTFYAAGSIKMWRKILKRAEDKSFKKVVRQGSSTTRRSSALNYHSGSKSRSTVPFTGSGACSTTGSAESMGKAPCGSCSTSTGNESRPADW